MFKPLSTENIHPDNHRFYRITQVAYIIGVFGHIFAGIRFYKLGIMEMVWFNCFYSVPGFAFAFFVNRKGHHNLAFAVAFTELLLHQAFGIYFIGWDSGLYFWLIYLIGLSFFNANWGKGIRFLLFSIVFVGFIILYLFFRTPESYIMSPSQYQYQYLASSTVALLLIGLLINYYVQNASKAESKLKLANQVLSEQKIQIEKTLDERNHAYARLNEELNEAAEYVKNILPEPISQPDLNVEWRFIPSASLGGDAFGYHWIDPDHFSVYLIDVSGHGVGPALLSVSVMNTLRSQSLPDTDFKCPESVLDGLNKAYPGESNNDMFFTIWYGVYNCRTRQMDFASGGHPPALLIENATEKSRTVNRLRTPNLAIGTDEDTRYSKDTLLIRENSTLLLFSDGVYEIETAQGQCGALLNLKNSSLILGGKRPICWIN